VTLEWKSEAAEVVATLSQLDEGIALMPQPYVAIAQANLPDLKVALDLNQAWEDLDNGSLMITGVLVIRSDFLEQYPGQVMAFLDEYQASTAFANENVPEAAQLVEKYGLFKAAIAQKAIPFCNITYLDGAEMQTAMEGYLNVLFQQNPKSVGGTLPDDAFYVNR
jgi:NitT/TauT family transport system substrate-binding protein